MLFKFMKGQLALMLCQFCQIGMIIWLIALALEGITVGNLFRSAACLLVYSGAGIMKDFAKVDIDALYAQISLNIIGSVLKAAKKK